MDRTAWWRASRRKSTRSAPGATPTSGRASSGPTNTACPKAPCRCVDCHNPHGSVLPRSIQTTRANEPGCAKCHGDKVGPFPFEHAPVRLEGCGACHQPHGSANPRMLTRAAGAASSAWSATPTFRCRIRRPMRRWERWRPALHDLRSPRFQNCTLCHQKVHGSYVNRDLFK